MPRSHLKRKLLGKQPAKKQSKLSFAPPPSVKDSAPPVAISSPIPKAGDVRSFLKPVGVDQLVAEDTHNKVRVKKNMLKSDIRLKVVSMLEDALLPPSFENDTDPAAEKGSLMKDIFWLANLIEDELFSFHQEITGTGYRSKARSLCFNLKDADNSWLREGVLSGAISPHRLCRMTTLELASEQKKSERDRAEVQGVQALEHALEQAVVRTTDYACPECGVSDATYSILSEKRDCGKSDTWGNKDTSTSVIQVSCCECKHAWKIEQ